MDDRLIEPLMVTISSPIVVYLLFAQAVVWRVDGDDHCAAAGGSVVSAEAERMLASRGRKQEAAGDRFRIGEVANLVGTTARTIRYYEELGLLGAAAGRSKGRHRLYSEADVARLRELMRLRQLLGLSLDELMKLAEAAQARDCLRDRWEGTTDDVERASIVRESIPLVMRQLELVQSRQRNLDEFENELMSKLELMRQRLAELEGGHPG